MNEQKSPRGLFCEVNCKADGIANGFTRIKQIVDGFLSATRKNPSFICL